MLKRKGKTKQHAEQIHVFVRCLSVCTRMITGNYLLPKPRTDKFRVMILVISEIISIA